jgi:hypothetical protein
MTTGWRLGRQRRRSSRDCEWEEAGFDDFYNSLRGIIDERT